MRAQTDGLRLRAMSPFIETNHMAVIAVLTVSGELGLGHLNVLGMHERAFKLERYNCDFFPKD